MISDREWMFFDPTQREILYQLRSIKVGVWLIASLMMAVILAVAFAIAFHA